jgi:group I intron endonuclease
MTKNIGTIYIFQNKINNKCYAGQTTIQFNKTLSRHYKSKYLLGKAIEKYGLENFKIFKFIDIPIGLLDFCEQQLILRLNSMASNGYNLESGGHKNKSIHQETKDKVSKTRIEKGVAKGEKNPNYGKHLSEESKKKISESHKGLLVGEKHPQYGRIRLEIKGKNSKVSKSVICLNINEIFNTITEASLKYNINHASISAVCKNKRKSARKDSDGNKLHWMYYSDYKKL